MTEEHPNPRELELGRQIVLLRQEVAQLKKARESEWGGRSEDDDNNHIAAQRHTDTTAETEHFLFEAVFDQYPIAMVAVSAPDFVVRYVNRPAIDFLGISDEPSYIGLTVVEIRRRQTWCYGSIDGTPLDLFDMPLARSLHGSETRNLTSYVVTRKDGTRRYGLVNATPVFNPAGDLLVGLVTFVDITEQKLAEEKVTRLANEQRTILNTIGMGIGLVKKRQMQWVNPAFAKMFGYEIDELQGVDTRQFYADPADFENAGKEGYPRLALGLAYSIETLMKRKDGAVFLCSLRGQAINSANPEEGSIWVLSDITEQRRTEDALRANEERFKRLVQNSIDIISVTDDKGVNISIHGPLERVLGYTPEELIGTNSFAIIHPDDRERAVSAFSDVAKQPGAVGSAELRHLHKNGSWVTAEAVGANLLHDPFVRGMVINIRDLSERNKLQEQLQQAMKMEAVGRLAGGVAHDFNNLLTIISGNVELARLVLNPSDPLTQYLDEIYYAADSATALTRQLLAFSRRQIIQPILLNLNDLVSNLQKMLGRLLGEDIELQTKLDEELGSVIVDPGQFEQVLVNLAVNARDAMPKGGKLIIETRNMDFNHDSYVFYPPTKPNKSVLLTVTDTGNGMSEEVKNHLFEPFFTTKPVGQGTGLGLATTFGAIKQAGGTIEVQSEKGVGTTFEIFLPRIEKAAEKLDREKRLSDTPRGSETILLVEDDVRIGNLALKALKRQGYKVIYAPNGGEAFMLAEKYSERIDLVITDVVMPIMNGRELAERLRKLHPEMKVLFTSGYTEDVILHHGVVEKNLNFIGKPYSFRAIARKVRNVLDSTGDI